ncbi:MAG: DUF456 family protein [Planctomycetaceae bacterium]
MVRPVFDAAPLWVYWFGGIVLLLANVACWVATFFTLPGNWGIVLLAALFVVLIPEQENGLGLNWWEVGVLVALAGLGELLELIAGAAGAAKHGASRRAILLSMVGAMVGSIAGAFVGVPVPFVGPIIAALGGGALGTFAGAYLGETWNGRANAEKLSISQAALVGRLLGTFGKLVAGGAMVIYATVAFFWL